MENSVFKVRSSSGGAMRLDPPNGSRRYVSLTVGEKCPSEITCATNSDSVSQAILGAMRSAQAEIKTKLSEAGVDEKEIFDLLSDFSTKAFDIYGEQEDAAAAIAEPLIEQMERALAALTNLFKAKTLEFANRIDESIEAQVAKVEELKNETLKNKGIK